MFGYPCESGRPVGQRAHELLRRAATLHLLFKISKALNEEKRRNRGHVEIVHQGRFVNIQAFER